MKKKIFSLLGILILGVNTVFCQAVSVSYDSLDSQNEEFYIDDEESLQEFENILEEDEEIFVINNFQESSLEATENNYIDKNVSRINALNSEEQVLENLNIPEDLNYTIVDITDVFTGNIISHDCNLYLVSNFDELEHWNECSVCGKIVNKEIHNYVDNGWTIGDASNCSSKNMHVFTCNCGYNYETSEGRKTHVFNYQSNNNYSYSRYVICSVCYDENVSLGHKCIKSDGSIINCLNPGKCALCGYTYSAIHQGGNYETVELGSLGPVYCFVCNKYMGTVNSVEYKNTGDGNFQYVTNVSINGSYSSLTYGPSNSLNTVASVSNSISGLTQISTVSYTVHSEFIVSLSHLYLYKQNGLQHRLDAISYVKPENKPPVITNINSNTGNWTTDSTISISGTENYCNTVNLTLKDTMDNIYAENIKASVTNKNWSYEIKPSLESKENTEFILVVSDNLDNIAEQSFYLSKIDAIPPKVIETETLNTDWNKTKDYVFISSDYGIGQVQNSAISTDNYELATENENIFYKGYTFTGDVYGETFVPVYMKDGLGNQNVEFISVSNLDNTPPTIENIEYDKTLHNTEITILVNDINEKLNVSGSGVTGYAISKENEIPFEFQESNIFNLTEAGKYYLFVTDAVGNVTSKEIYIPIQYKVTINPDGGTWKGSMLPQEIETDEPINLYPEPEKEGYAFKEWNIEGNASINEDGELIIGGDVQVTPIWETNTYPVIFIDYDVTNNEEMKRTTKELNYNTLASGFDLGNDISDNAYYPQYRLLSSTEIKVSTNPENNIVYRYFEFCYTSKESHLNFNDNENQDGLRPETYKLQLILENGELIQEVTLPTTEPDYTFTNLSKYNPQGEEYNYKIVPIISERYTPTEPDENGNITVIYNNPACSINIPKTTTLDGKDGNLTYTIQVEANLFYKDKIILVPEENVILTDGVKNMIATITQDKTEFNKEDELQVTGRIQTTKKHFAGTWHGTFNFKIKYEVSNE